MFASGEGGHKLLVELLLDNGANVDERDKFGMTPLMRAAQHGRTDVVNFLLDNDADVNAINNYGWNALMIAIEKGR